MTPAASFIIPVYNGAAYIAESIKSCLNSSAKKIEVVVVDDCSTDATEDIVKAMAAADDRVKLVTHVENMGRSAARNTGMESATSDIFMTLDHDDIALPSRAATTIKAFKDNRRVDIVYSQFQIIDELGEVQAKVDVAPFSWDRLLSTKLAYIGHSTMAIRKSVYKKVKYTGGDFCKHAIDDWKFQVDCYKAGFKFMPIRKCLSQYRWIEKKRDEAKILELKNSCLK